MCLWNTNKKVLCRTYIIAYQQPQKEEQSNTNKYSVNRGPHTKVVISK